VDECVQKNLEHLPARVLRLHNVLLLDFFLLDAIAGNDLNG
jgi:hypothetical protein